MAQLKYNVVSLKRQGLTDADIAQFIAEDEGRDYQSLLNSGLTDKDIISFANEVQASTGEVLYESFKRGATSSFRGAKQLLGGQPTDQEILDESYYRQLEEQNPILANTGNIVGNIFGDPTNLIPGGLLFKGAKGAASVAGRLGILGGIAGALEPRYTEDDPSILANIATGAVTTGLLGGALAKATGFTGDANKLVGEIGSDIKGNALADITPFDNAETVATLSAPKYVQDAIQGVDNVVELPKLSAFLEPKKPPNWGKSEIVFDTDLDKALWELSKSTKTRKTALETFLTTNLNTDTETVNKLAKQVQAEVIDKVKGLQITEGGAPKVPFQMSKTLDNFINPVDKNLDDLSKTVYNYGATLGKEVDGKFTLNLTKAKEDFSFQEISKLYNQAGIKAADYDIALDIKGYNKMLDELKRIEGPNFKPKSFDEYALRGMSIEEEMALRKSGAFDGC